MQKLILFFCLMMVMLRISAQTTIHVIDTNQQKPISEVSIDVEAEFTDASESLLTDSLGNVVTHIPVPFVINVFTTGYLPVQMKITDVIKSITIPLLQLQQQLNEITVTGQYNVTTTDASVYNVKVISQDAIQQKNASNLKDLLENEIGIKVSQDNILGSSISLNGISGQNIKVLVDGVPMIGRENGNLDLSSINLNNIQQVEMIEGPMSVMYGTDALGGVINLITDQGNKHAVDVDGNFNYESIGTYNADGMLTFHNKQHNFLLSGGRYFFDGWNNPDTGRYQTYKPKQKIFAGGQYAFRSRDFDFRLKLDGSMQEIQNKGMPVVNPYNAYAFDDYYFTNRFDVSMFNEYRMNNNSKLTFTNSFSLYNHIKNTYRKNMVDLSQDLVSTVGTQDTSNFNSWLFRGAWSNVNPFHRATFQTGDRKSVV